jgi:hypothetical protein
MRLSHIFFHGFALRLGMTLRQQFFVFLQPTARLLNQAAEAKPSPLTNQIFGVQYQRVDGALGMEYRSTGKQLPG